MDNRPDVPGDEARQAHACRTTYSYDARGRLARVTLQIGTRQLSYRCAWDEATGRTVPRADEDGPDDAAPEEGAAP